MEGQERRKIYIYIYIYIRCEVNIYFKFTNIRPKKIPDLDPRVDAHI